MKRALPVVCGLAILALCAAPAFAGQVSLGESGTNGGLLNTPASTLHFTSTGGGTFGLVIGNGMGNSITNGVALDDFGGSVENGYYSIVQTGGTITGAYNSVTNVFDITQTPSTNITFYYGVNSPDGKDATYLAGNLQLVSLQQTASTKTGVFNESLVVNLTNISSVCTTVGGSCNLLSDFTTGNGMVQITLHFSSTTNLMTAAAGAKLGAYISTGSVTPQSLPEPGSLALFGTGLVGLGGFARFKLRLRRR